MGEIMKTYDVTIKMEVTKTYRVEAEDDEEAVNGAYDICTAAHEPEVPVDFYIESVVDVQDVQFYTGLTLYGQDQIVTNPDHDERFYAKTGPFKTRAAAQYMIDNPMIQTVSEVEEAMKL
jgi:hypothetical protein